MITPTRLREIYAEELRKLGEDNRADRVLDGSDTNAVSLAAIKALHRVADEAPQVVVFEALKNRLKEISDQHSDRQVVTAELAKRADTQPVPDAVLDLIDVTGRDGG